MKHLRQACSWPCQSPWEQCSVHLWWWEWVPRAFPSSPLWRELGRIHLSDNVMTQTGLQGLKPAVWAVLIQIHRKWWWWLKQHPLNSRALNTRGTSMGGAELPQGTPGPAVPPHCCHSAPFRKLPATEYANCRKGNSKGMKRNSSAQRRQILKGLI